MKAEKRLSLEKINITKLTNLTRVQGGNIGHLPPIVVDTFTKDSNETNGTIIPPASDI